MLESLKYPLGLPRGAWFPADRGGVAVMRRDPALLVEPEFLTSPGSAGALGTGERATRQERRVQPRPGRCPQPGSGHRSCV